MRALVAVIGIAFVAVSASATDYFDKSEVLDLAGTSWEMTESSGEKITWNLEPNGVLSYKSNTGFWRNGSWKQNGQELYIETNNKYYEAVGTVYGDQVDNGRFWNTAGLKGAWTGKRK
ncbi:MAG TPA: hypothetical protein VGZ47_20275 [Gemmataceae bacterium]|jgi:hypothetical protein|nr:hypothetical protein [Gemmataceae bacterium]